MTFMRLAEPTYDGVTKFLQAPRRQSFVIKGPIERSWGAASKKSPHRNAGGALRCGELRKSRNVSSCLSCTLAH